MRKVPPIHLYHFTPIWIFLFIFSLFEDKEFSKRAQETMDKMLKEYEQ